MAFRTDSRWIELYVEVFQDVSCSAYFSFGIFADGLCVEYIKNSQSRFNQKKLSLADMNWDNSDSGSPWGTAKSGDSILSQVC